MKKLIGLLAIVVTLNSCVPVLVVNPKHKHAPPGQVKKVTGSQSAKPYAPGQKKH
ncbi:MAG: hypothetical protein ABIR06_04860 [Cyclobacteriaceae bacterium]